MCISVFKSFFCGRSSKKSKPTGLGRSMAPRPVPLAHRSPPAAAASSRSSSSRRAASHYSAAQNSSLAGPAYERDYPMMTPVNVSLKSLPESAHCTPAAGPVAYGNSMTPEELQELAKLRVAGVVGSSASSNSMSRAARVPLRAYDKGKFPKTLRSSEYRPRH